MYDDLGDYPRALENNLKDLEIYEELARNDPKNNILQRGIAISSANTAASYARVGKLDLALDYSNRSLQIMHKVIAAAPEKGYGSRVLASLLIYRGSILMMANQPEAAIAEIEHGRMIFQSLYKSGGVDQVYVAAADVKLAQAEFQAGHDEAAAVDFREALNIADPLIEANNLEAIYAAADAHAGLGNLSAKQARRHGQTAEARMAHWTEAQKQYQQSLDEWHRLEHPNHSSPIMGFPVGDPALVAKQLSVAKSEISSH